MIPYTLNLRVHRWTVQMSVHMDRAFGYRLTADCKTIRSNKFYIAGNSKPFSADAHMIVLPKYTTPEQAMLGGQPIGRLVSESLMEKEPRLVGRVSYVPEFSDPDGGTFDESLSCVVYTGTAAYDELLQRHRAGSVMPATMSLHLEGLDGAGYDDTIWDTKKYPELPIVEMTFDMVSIIPEEPST